jgi:hypothetical protein
MQQTQQKLSTINNEMKQRYSVVMILFVVITIMTLVFPNVLSLAHIMHKWPSIPICKPLINGTQTTHHETEGNVSVHINNCA